MVDDVHIGLLSKTTVMLLETELLDHGVEEVHSGVLKIAKNCV